jgi:hypothetical protein
MANAVYPKAKDKFMKPETLGTTSGDAIDLIDDNLKVVLVDLADYTYSASHEFLSDVPAGARVATSGNLASKSVTDGVFDAADVTFSAVSGDQSEALVIYKDTGTASSSPLIAFIDTVSSGLPVTPNGGDITVTWDNGANKIFKL